MKQRRKDKFKRWFNSITLRDWLILISVIVVIVVVVLLSTRKKISEPEPPMVEIQKVEQRKVEVFSEYPGNIRAQQFVEVRARVEGYLQRMTFEEGSYVEREQVLFVIDPSQYQAKVDKAKSQVEKNKAMAEKAKRDLDRIKPLYEQRAASQLDYDNALAAYESAQAEVKMSEADLKQDQLALSYTTVRSPISGYISERYVDEGALVGPGAQSLLTTIVKSDTVLVEFNMTALDYQKSLGTNVKIGQTTSGNEGEKSYVTITLADNSVYKHRGDVDFADPQVDSRTGTVSVRATLPNPDHELLPGQFTRVKLLTDVRENAVVVPTKAIIIEKDGYYVWVLTHEDSIAKKRKVNPGSETEDNLTILEKDSELRPWELVVVEGMHKLTVGQKAIGHLKD